jgi:hypothetical protein
MFGVYSGLDACLERCGLRGDDVQAVKMNKDHDLELTAVKNVESSVGKAPRRLRGAGSHQTHRSITFVVGSFGVDSVLLTEGSILDPGYEIWNFANKYRGGGD